MLNKDFGLGAIRLSLASPEQIMSWSYGEVTKPETINYRTLKPAKDGLFCEKIFGPTKDYECACGKYRKIQYKGVKCDRCGVEVTKSEVRRERMGHIKLAAPMVHPWLGVGVPSYIGVLLGLTPRSIERVIYFAQYIITHVDESAAMELMKRIREETSEKLRQLEEMLEGKSNSISDKATQEEIEQLIERKDLLEAERDDRLNEIEDLRPLMMLTENCYREIKKKCGDIFEVGMGAEAILTLLKGLDLDDIHERMWNEIKSTSGQRRKKAIKRLSIIEAFRRSGSRPEWMILTVLPVMPPDLRPMVQLEGGRFATTDINDLYRRVINRNNRLKRLLDIEAPQIIIRNEKRMLQEAVDSLIANGRQGKSVNGEGNRPLKSLSDLLRGKQGRFRQNLLGKRVDYSGRSVIIIGPELKLHQCGLPRRMAQELFKPFIMHKLIQRGIAANIKSAKRIVEQPKEEVWDILEEVASEHPVMLNRAPTLHRLGIQAFEPVLIDGSAIQIHPLVCSAFNADFDGDQMAVHVPLSRNAVREARGVILSTHNMLLPSNGEPTVAPTLDIVLGCHYLTSIKKHAKGEGYLFGNFEEARLAYEFGVIDLRAEIEVHGSPPIISTMKGKDGSGGGNGSCSMTTTVGRIIFNEKLPLEIGFFNEVMDKSKLKLLTAQCVKKLDESVAASVLNEIKELGFYYATKSGITIAASDLIVPPIKPQILKKAEEHVEQIKRQYDQGLMSEDERYRNVVKTWIDATDEITDAISNSLDHYGGIYMMANSGAKGDISQIRQMAGMRGLMTDPVGKIIEFPIKSCFREGLPVLEYFVSTHGARKGLADTALRTSNSGYLSRRLVDSSQDLVVRERDCGTTEGIWLTESAEGKMLASLLERITGRLAASQIVDPQNGEIIVERNEEIDEEKAERIIAMHIRSVYVRSPLSCQSRCGICQYCYGRDLARNKLIDKGAAIGIIAAQSIGEPGTQLTLRTFHTGGVVGTDITSGLPRVEELFDARNPKGQAIISDIDGEVEILSTEEGHKIRVTGSERYRGDSHILPPNAEIMVQDGSKVEVGTILARTLKEVSHPPEGIEIENQGIEKESLPLPQTPITIVVAHVDGEVVIEGNTLHIECEEPDIQEYSVPFTTSICVKTGDRAEAGDRLTEGYFNLHDLLRIKGKESVQRYVVDEVQKVYRSQGVSLNDKHIEVIVHQMLHKVRIDSPGDTDMLPGELVDRFTYEDTNAMTLAEGGEPATAQPVVLGVTKVALSGDSFLAAASFQESTRVLAEAAVKGKVDYLRGIKENVILGRLIPARSLTEDTTMEALPQLCETGI